MATSKPRRLTNTVRFWLAALATLATTDAITWALTPGLVDSGAYQWARTLAPQHAWAALSAIAAASAIAALIGDNGHRRWPADAARIALAAYSLFALTVGLSIAILTLNGSHGALTGATKWWLPVAICFRVARRRSLIHHDTHILALAARRIRADDT